MNELMKTTFQILFAGIIGWFIELSLKMPDKLENEFGIALESNDREKIQRK